MFSLLLKAYKKISLVGSKISKLLTRRAKHVSFLGYIPSSLPERVISENLFIALKKMLK